MRAALDTNLLIDAEGFGDEARVSATRQLRDLLSEADLVVPLSSVQQRALKLQEQCGAESLWIR
jgi:predicted GTPase